MACSGVSSPVSSRATAPDGCRSSDGWKTATRGDGKVVSHPVCGPDEREQR
ncbi:hypothetical protein [Nonomuraea salmonea]|uniref:hypothetical protein n=1 Tax=Nonomuraea salmonea TaxID=46181 RepID=UPI0031EAD79A